MTDHVIDHMTDHVIDHMTHRTESVQTSLESKFSGGKPGTIPITPTADFASRMAVCSNYSPPYLMGCTSCVVCV